MIINTPHSQISCFSSWRRSPVMSSTSSPRSMSRISWCFFSILNKIGSQGAETCFLNLLRSNSSTLETLASNHTFFPQLPLPTPIDTFHNLRSLYLGEMSGEERKDCFDWFSQYMFPRLSNVDCEGEMMRKIMKNSPRLRVRGGNI